MHFGIEIDPTWLETTVVEDRKHALGGQIDVGGELIGVPTQHHIARIGVNATQGTSGDATSSSCCMVWPAKVA